MNKKTFTLQLGSYLYSENAEDSQLILEAWFVQAVNQYGLTFNHTYTFKGWDGEKRAEKALESMNRRMTADWSPVDNEYWVQGDYVYGSSAYADNYEQAELALMTEGERDRYYQTV